MVNYTINHGYQLYEDGEKPWEHRDDFEKLDAEVELRGPDAELQNHEPKEGALYRATDTGAVYLGDGTDWNKADISVAEMNAETATAGSVSSNHIGYNYDDEYPPMPVGVPGDDTAAVSLVPHKAVSNPVLTGADVTEFDATNGVADPFIVRHDGLFYMFFEAYSGTRAAIAYATSVDGFDWNYQSIVLEHTDVTDAFPHVFRWNGTWYMVPNHKGSTTSDFRIFEANPFPDTWTEVELAMSGSELSTSPNLWGSRGKDHNDNNLWNSGDMHHVDLAMPYTNGGNIVPVDGHANGEWSIGIYALSYEAPTECRLHMGSTTTAASSTYTTLPFNNPVYDPGRNYDGGAGGYVVPESGLYEVTMNARWTSLVGSPCRLMGQVMADGTVFGETLVHAAADDDVSTMVTCKEYLTEGEVIGGQVWQNSGNSADVVNWSTATYLNIKRVR